MASLIRMKYASDSTDYLTLNVDGAFRVDVSGGDARIYYNIPAQAGQVWVVDCDFNNVLVAADVTNLEALIVEAQQEPGSSRTWLVPSDTTSFLNAATPFTIGDEVYP